MQIRLKLYNEFKRFAPQGAADGFTLQDSADVGELLQRLGIGKAAPKVILINGRRADLQDPLSPGDTVVLFSPICGG